jgi:hypothetical protein
MGIDVTKPMKILAIGNSFSVDSMEYLWNIANDYGYRNVVLGNLYIGGCSLETHYNNSVTKSKSYTYYKNTRGEWKEKNDVTLLDGLFDENWDVITMQQASGKSGIASSYEPFLSELIRYVNKYKKKAALAWNMTWAYQSDSQHGEFINYDNDQIKMYHSIIEITKKIIISNNNFNLIIPVGTAIQNIRSSSVGDHLTRDGFHLSLGLGRYIAGLTWFVTIFKSPINEIKFYPKNVTLEEVELAKKAVNNAINNPFNIDAR